MLREIVGLLGRLFVLLLMLLLCLPVLLLPPATAVPVWLWMPLAIADVALIVLFFRLTPAWKGALIGLAGVLLVGVLALLDAPHKEIVWFEHSGHTPWVSESDRFVQAMVEKVLGGR
jgi:pimeloyl-ACP methyl ester carboxylesterase